MKSTVQLLEGRILTVAALEVVEVRQAQDSSIRAMIAAGSSQTFGPYPLDRDFTITGRATITTAEDAAYASGSGGGDLPAGIVVTDSEEETVLLPEALATCAVATSEITTGASPLTADLEYRVFSITTGGTQDSEVINLPKFPLDGNGFNLSKLGSRVIFYLDTQTDEADAVNINEPDLVGGVFPVYQTSLFQNHYKQNTTSVVLDFAGAVACFIWVGFEWHMDIAITNNGDDATFNGSNDTKLYSNKDVLIRADLDGAGGGNIKMTTLPTSNPAVAGALWNDAGTLKISAG